MKTLNIDNFFTSEVHSYIKEAVKQRDFPIDLDLYEYFREGSHNPPFLVHIHKQLSEVASHIFGEPVKPSYCFLSMYGKNGICPIHTDRPQCKYSIDYCIDTDCEWPIFINNEAFVSKPNHAVCLSGTDDPHYRNKINGTFCDLVFFHFVPVGFEGKLE